MARRRLLRPVGAVPGTKCFVAYYRVSTDQQGRSGLGLEAQKHAVADQVAQVGGLVVAEFQEIESGKRVDRPQLAAALSACRARRATLIIAKLDRLARNARFLLDVVEGCGDGGVLFCDLPQMPDGAVGKFLVTLLAAVAELEAGLISQRTKSALAAAKARGVRLGNPALKPGTRDMAIAANAVRTGYADAHAVDVAPFIGSARAAGAMSLRAIADSLTARGVRTPMGGERWTATQVSRVLARIDANGATPNG